MHVWHCSSFLLGFCAWSLTKPVAFVGRKAYLSSLWSGPQGQRLKHPTKPSSLIEADEGTAEGHEGLVDIYAPLVPDGQTAEAVQPPERLFDNLAVRPLIAVQATSGNAFCDGASLAFSPAAVGIVGFLSGNYVGALARTVRAVAHAGHGNLRRAREDEAIVAVAELRRTPSRVPRWSSTRWCFASSLLRSVGFGSV